MAKDGSWRQTSRRRNRPTRSPSPRRAGRPLTTRAASRDYRVELDVYNGPLDLLLYLLKRDELDIYDIPIARITDSYMQYVNMLRGLSERGRAGHQRRRRLPRDGGDADGDQVGDAAAQARRSSRARTATRRRPQELADPRHELVQKLLEYKRFKDSATLLERQRREHAEPFPALPGEARRASRTSRRRSIWTRCRSGTCWRRSTG